MLSHSGFFLALSPWCGPSWPLGLTELTVATESSASGLMSSTLWSTARRAQRDRGEAVTFRRAWEAGRLCAGLKFKPTCGIGDKDRKANSLIYPCIHQHFLGAPQIQCIIALFDFVDVWHHVSLEAFGSLFCHSDSHQLSYYNDICFYKLLNWRCHFLPLIHSSRCSCIFLLALL